LKKPEVENEAEGEGTKISKNELKRLQKQA
jgi:hypothetical protein